MKIRCTTPTTLSALAAAVALAGVNCSYGQDECATATTIAANTPTAYSTVTATPSAGLPSDATCAGTYLNWLETQNDVWFKFTATESGMAEFTTCDAASYDTSLVLYKTTCDNQVACNGDGTGGTGCQTYYSRIADVACMAGDVFYARIGGYDGAVGAGNFTVNFQPSSAGCVGATGACNEPHGGLGCDNPTCCTNTCIFNPLCCEIGWDADCVVIAIQQCGYYSCGPVSGAPANNCATAATAISSADSAVNFNSTNATVDGPNHPGGCASGNEFFYHDVWYKVSPIANGSMGLSTCGSVGYDNKIAVYDMGTDPASYDFNAIAASLVGCIDDGASGACMLDDGITPYAAEMWADVQLGHTYLIRIGSYEEIGFGAGVMRVDMPESCALPTPTGSEGEDCGLAINDGCNGDGGSITVAPNSVTSGTFWADADSRDTDFYTLSVGADTALNVSVHSGRLVTVFVLTGDLSVAGCTAVTVVATGDGSCPSTAAYCMNAGTYHIFVADADFNGNPCGSGTFNDYTLTVSTSASSCPITVSGAGAVNGTCSAPGSVSQSLNTDPNTVVSGVVACAVNPAAPNCSGGGTTANTYARVFPAGQLTGEISCINFGVFAVKRALNGTVCASFYSDLALPATIGIYRDLDGGTPRKKTVDGGTDGGDLELIASQEVRIPGGVYRATLNFSEAVCVMDDVGYNLVVIMDCPNLYDGAGGVPGASGYGIRAGANAAGPGSNTYCRLSCADAAGQYVLTESIGATFTAQWVVMLNGSNGVNCGAPSCPADFNGDGLRDGLDMTVILSNWGGAGGDVNGDGTTDGIDMTVLLSGWGVCP